MKYIIYIRWESVFSEQFQFIFFLHTKHTHTHLHKQQFVVGFCFYWKLSKHNPNRSSCPTIYLIWFDLIQQKHCKVNLCGKSLWFGPRKTIAPWGSVFVFWYFGIFVCFGWAFVSFSPSLRPSCVSVFEWISVGACVTDTVFQSELHFLIKGSFVA